MGGSGTVAFHASSPGRAARLLVSAFGVALCVTAFAPHSASAATFTHASPAASGFFLTTTSVTFSVNTSATPGQTINGVATISVDGGTPVSVGANYPVVTGSYYDPNAYDGEGGTVYTYDESQAIFSQPLTMTLAQHQIVLTVTELPSNQTFTYTWNVAPEPCKSCHIGYPVNHPSSVMSQCTLCHTPTNRPVYAHSGTRAISLAGCSGSASLCHGGAANHNGSYLGAHVHYDLDGNPQDRAELACSTCHTVSANHTTLGGTSFTYQDLRDLSPKTAGGYDCSTCHGGAGITSPHGGYAATSNKCKVCHAVHRAQGGYYLLRADSAADACEYCHTGGSAHGGDSVYYLNPGGTDTTNGHTIGSMMIPDSTTSQTAQAVTVTGTNELGQSISESVFVRAYDPQSLTIYRFSRHHSQNAASTGRSGFKPVGPNNLTCFSCHQPHAAPAQSWQPSKFTTGFADVAGTTTSYKLLRRYPSGGWVGKDADRTFRGSTNSYGYVDVQDAIKVPETDLTTSGPNANYSTKRSAETTYTENGLVSSQPVWIAQNISGDAAGTGDSRDPATVNQYALSVWCADCHNLNIGGSQSLTQEELGFKAHTERTHPAPFTGSHYGPGQCYSCHRNDLSVAIGTGDPAGYGSGQAAPVGGTTDACSQCHYGTQAYRDDTVHTSGRDTDFPHSGKETDIKLLGSYTASVASTGTYTPVFTAQAVNEDNLDAVCIRCHPGVGVHN